MLIVDHQPMQDCYVTATYTALRNEVVIDVERDGHKLYTETRPFNEIQGNVYMALSEAVSKAKKGVTI